MPGIYEKYGTYKEFTIYKAGNKKDSGKIKCHVLAPDPNLIAINKTKNRIGVAITPTVITETRSMPNHEFTTIKEHDIAETRSTLEYLGITGNTIKIRYKEYHNNKTTPINTSDALFDLDKSNTIQFKDHKLEIIKADESEVIYQRINESQEIKSKKTNSNFAATRFSVLDEG